MRSVSEIVQEAVSHALLFGVLVASGLNFSGALLLLIADLLLIMLLSIPVHQAGSLDEYLRRLLLLLGTLAFLLFTCSAAYGIAIRGGNLQLDAEFLARMVAFEPGMLVWMVALSALHLLVMLIYAWSQPEPRVAWDRVTSVASVGTLTSLFLLTFMILLLGEPAIALARRIDAALDQDTVLIALMIGLRLICCCLLVLAPNAEQRRPSRS